MDADLVTLRVHPSHQIRVRRHASADDEERGRNPCLRSTSRMSAVQGVGPSSKVSTTCRCGDRTGPAAAGVVGSMTGPPLRTAGGTGSVPACGLWRLCALSDLAVYHARDQQRRDENQHHRPEQHPVDGRFVVVGTRSAHQFRASRDRRIGSRRLRNLVLLALALCQPVVLAVPIGPRVGGSGRLWSGRRRLR